MFFNKNKGKFETTTTNIAEPEFGEYSTDEQANIDRENAITYISSLGKADKDNFIAGVELIWQGYNQMTSVKTRLQREIQREANRKTGGTDTDDDFGGFLE